MKQRFSSTTELNQAESTPYFSDKENIDIRTQTTSIPNLKKAQSPLVRKKKGSRAYSSNGSQINFDIKSAAEWSQNDNKKVLLSNTKTSQ